MPNRHLTSGFMTTSLDRIERVVEASKEADLTILSAVLRLGDPTVGDLEAYFKAKSGTLNRKLQPEIDAGRLRRVHPGNEPDGRVRRIYITTEGVITLAKLMDPNITISSAGLPQLPQPPKGSVDK